MGFGLTACVEPSSSPSVTQASANRHVLIVNRTGRTIYRFYGSNVSRSSWEEDILGNSVLASGNSLDINFDDGSGYCNFDFKVEFADGSSYVRNNINVCTTATYTLS